MRNFVIFLLLVAALGYGAYNYRREIVQRVPALAPLVPAEESSSDEVAGSVTPTPAPPAPVSPAETPQLAPPGIFYAKERVVVQGDSGIKALRPGEEVRLMYRHKDGRMLVTNGRYEFTVAPASLTRDRAEALRGAPR